MTHKNVKGKKGGKFTSIPERSAFLDSNRLNTKEDGTSTSSIKTEASSSKHPHKMKTLHFTKEEDESKVSIKHNFGTTEQVKSKSNEKLDERDSMRGELSRNQSPTPSTDRKIRSGSGASIEQNDLVHRISDEEYDSALPHYVEEIEDEFELEEYMPPKSAHSKLNTPSASHHFNNVRMSESKRFTIDEAKSSKNLKDHHEEQPHKKQKTQLMTEVTAYLDANAVFLNTFIDDYVERSTIDKWILEKKCQRCKNRKNGKGQGSSKSKHRTNSNEKGHVHDHHHSKSRQSVNSDGSCEENPNDPNHSHTEQQQIQFSCGSGIRSVKVMTEQDIQSFRQLYGVDLKAVNLG